MPYTVNANVTITTITVTLSDENNFLKTKKFGNTFFSIYVQQNTLLNHLTSNDHYMGRTAQLTSRCCILYIYSTNIRTEYFKYAT